MNIEKCVYRIIRLRMYYNCRSSFYVFQCLLFWKRVNVYIYDVVTSVQPISYYMSIYKPFYNTTMSTVDIIYMYVYIIY